MILSPPTNTSHLSICPDGQLSRVPFEILPVGNRFLLEENMVTYVTSGPEIVRLAIPKDQARVSKSVVMGDPDFDYDLVTHHRPAASLQLAVASTGLCSLTRHFDSLKFHPLPGAEAEARSVAALLGYEQDQLTQAFHFLKWLGQSMTECGQSLNLLTGFTVNPTPGPNFRLIILGSGKAMRAVHPAFLRDQ